MGHIGQGFCTLDEVLAVPVPDHTKSWAPDSYGDCIEMVKDAMKSEQGLEPVSESYSMNKTGSQMFSVFNYEVPGLEDSRFSLGLRQAYDKSFARGLVGGESLIVCDNLCFSGNMFKVTRKNTLYVRGDFEKICTGMAKDLNNILEKSAHDRVRLQARPCNLDEGYEILGKMLGHGIISNHAASVAFQDWAVPRHQAFSDRNQWSLYNCITEGLKKVRPSLRITAHTNTHDYLVNHS